MSQRTGGSRAITVEPKEVERLRQDFKRIWARFPQRDELAELLLEHLGREMLLREALSLHLETSDTVARQCLVERAGSVLAAARGPVPAQPGDAELRVWFERHRHRFVSPARFTFEQVFVDPARHGPESNRRATDLLTRLQRPTDKPGAPAVPVRSLAPDVGGDDIDVGRLQRGRTLAEVAQLFGEGFAATLASAARDTWTGPLSSRLGLHLVRVMDVTVARRLSFEEARDAVRTDWLTAKRRGLQDAATELLAKYRVQLPAATAAELAGAPLAAKYLDQESVR